jgi:hypothetical protein
MQRNAGSSDTPITEMVIVDTFTKLIFGTDARFSAQEQQIIDALRVTGHGTGADDDAELGLYLRALGVEEMIGLVSEVHGQICRPVGRRARRGREPLRASGHH